MSPCWRRAAGPPSSWWTCPGHGTVTRQRYVPGSAHQRARCGHGEPRLVLPPARAARAGWCWPRSGISCYTSLRAALAATPAAQSPRRGITRTPAPWHARPRCPPARLITDTGPTPPVADTGSRRQRGGTAGTPPEPTHPPAQLRLRSSPRKRSPPRTGPGPDARQPSAAPAKESAPDTDAPHAVAVQRASNTSIIKVLRRSVESVLAAPVRMRHDSPAG